MFKDMWITEYGHTILLEKLSNPFTIHEYLKSVHLSTESRVQQLLTNKNAKLVEKIDAYYNHPSKLSRFRSKFNSPSELAKPINDTDNLKNIATEVSTYFKQGLEMFLTSMTMDINSSPLVEYYGFLQCIKGFVLLQLKVDNFLFSHHGMSPDHTATPDEFIKVKFNTHGVLWALILVESSLDNLNAILSRENNYSLKDFLCNEHNSIYVENFTPTISCFIISWMLSSLVRYKPLKWRTMCLGEESDIILRIKNYRREDLTTYVENFLNEYDRVR